MNIKNHLSNDGKTLDLGNFKLTELPELPEGLKYLYCGNNKLTELPELPELPKGLETLYCSNNQLTQLPELPKGLLILDCDYNQLTYKDLDGYWKWFWKENPDLHNANKMGLY